MKEGQTNLFGGVDVLSPEKTPIEKLSPVENMISKAKKVVEDLEPDLRSDVLHFVENADRSDSFALLRIIVKLKESRIERTIDDSGNDVDICGECGHKSRIYRRRIRLSHVRNLLELYHLGGSNEFFHVSEFTNPQIHSDFFLAGLFGLAEPKKNEDDPTKRASGFWRLSIKGIEFLKGECKIPEFLEVRENKIIRESENLVSVEDRLPAKFDYQEIFPGFKK